MKLLLILLIKNYLVNYSIINLISMNMSLYYPGKPLLSRKVKCPCISCGLHELSTSQVSYECICDYECIHLFAVWILSAGMGVSQYETKQLYINNIHERALRIVFRDYESTFKQFLKQNKSVTINQKILQILATRVFNTKLV